ncbi:PQQ-binding-like beta-propeller repeat protein [Kitasatospora brasiliensis]|uniref:PQQ-binding-like beta-propeller repeat protein n=1 Tax=Kitasatospora brasiliensis TaxID=3058040 RepID=UPI00292EA05A|nr:PQQ-binding-like beta-propeller repeat protein [Kitasatospora sp. K002]
MAQEPFEDARSQQPWQPQGHLDWQNGGYGESSEQEQTPQQPSQWQQQSAYGSAEYGQQQSQYGQFGRDAYGHGYTGYDQTGYDQGGYGQNGYGRTGHVEGGHVQGQYGGQEQYQPYPQYPDHAQQQHPYLPYADSPQPAGEGLYVPEGAEYSTDGYVRIEEAEAAPAPGPEKPEVAPLSRDSEPQAVPAASSRAATRRGAAGGTSGSDVGSSLSAKARKAADAVLTGEHVPSRRALLVRTGAGVAALGVLVAAGLMVGAESGGSAAASSGGEPGFAVAHTRTWAAQPAAAGTSASDDTLIGSWLLADAVVRADGSGVRAYDRTGGKPTWSVEPPAAGAVPCGLSAGVNQAGLGAALFRPQGDPKGPCALLSVVDTKTGKTAWTKTLSDTKGVYSAQVGVTEDKVVAVGDDRALAWESVDGKDVWQYTGQGRFCTLSGGVSGKTVLVASSCADSTPTDQAVSLNVADGKVSWWRGLNNQPKTVTVLSAEPSVVLTTGEKPENDRVFAWGPGGDPAAEIPVVGDSGRLDVAHGAFSATPEVYFEGRTMVTTLAPSNGSGPVAAVGYDLDTGKQRWKVPTAAKGAVRAVGVDGGSLVLAADERRDQPARLSRFPLAGGEEAVGGNFPLGTGSLLISGRVLIGGGQVVVVPEHSANYGTAAEYRAKD